MSQNPEFNDEFVEEKEENYTGHFYVCPAEIFESKILSLSEKHLYIFLLGLAKINDEGECWPSDAYLSHKLDFNITYINSILKKLEKIGLISRRTTRHPSNPFRTKRFIKVHTEIKKILTNSEKTEPRHQQNSQAEVIQNPKRNKISSLNKISMNEEDYTDKSQTDFIYESNKTKGEDAPKAKKEKPSQAKSAPSAVASELSEYFLSRIKETKKDFKQPNMEKWAKEFDLMLRVDERKPERIKAVIDGIKNSKVGFAYIQSPKKLRASFDQQEMHFELGKKMNRVFTNRTWAMHVKENYPSQYSSLTFNSDSVVNAKRGKGIYLDQDHEEFKEALMRLFGVKI